jgi:hypothetical protein
VAKVCDVVDDLGCGVWGDSWFWFGNIGGLFTGAFRCFSVLLMCLGFCCLCV